MTKPQLPASQNQIEEAIRTLKRPDKVGVAGTGIGTGAGVAAGAVASGTLAGAAGATTLFGSTTLANVFGGVLVTATPIGWVLGCGLVGGVAAYGIAKLIRSGAEHDQLRDEMGERLHTRVKTVRANTDPQGDFGKLKNAVTVAVSRHEITTAQADRILRLVASGKLNTQLAMDRLQAVAKPDSKHES